MYAAQAVPDATDFFTFFVCVIAGFRREADARSALFCHNTLCNFSEQPRSSPSQYIDK